MIYNFPTRDNEENSTLDYSFQLLIIVKMKINSSVKFYIYNHLRDRHNIDALSPLCIHKKLSIGI